jgi:23S rRNA (guanine2445-N2)-methyltransferase / 23S rRNA (guanine2069-N7)-methyltransferase
MIAVARENAERAGLAALVSFEHKNITDCNAPTKKGLLICNPPYGERLGDEAQLAALYQQIGQVMHDNFQGWQAAFLTSNPTLAKATGLRSSKQYSLFNGALACKLYIMLISGNKLKNQVGEPLSANAQMFANRLQKNYSHLQKWAKRSNLSCFRVYDADLPEYAFAIDYYDGYAVMQEYTPPATIAEHKAQQRRLDVLQATAQVLDIAQDKLINKQRSQQKGKNQYQKIDKTRQMITVNEAAAKFKVNLYDYLDTGLFLDHRPLRLQLAKLAAGTRMLNCFCYTATASVHAALAGAITTNVDMSNTYLRWAEDNFLLNNINLSRHQFIQFDCLEWLDLCSDKFDVIFLDPPSFSNSKRMKDTLDIQRDHPGLIRAAMRSLAPDGVLIFSNNFRKFKLDPAMWEEFEIKDVTKASIPFDFKRSRPHQCWHIGHKEQG